MQTGNDHPAVTGFEHYPPAARERLLALRELIYQTASELGDVGGIEESLKWGEPSFKTASGSPVRIDWKASSPDRYAMYFHCGSKLVDTFRELHGDCLQFEGNRAIVFEIDQELPVDVVKQCLSMALRYHRIKHLPLLGA